MRTSSSSGDQDSAEALRRLLRPFSLQSSAIDWYQGRARKRSARIRPGSWENPNSLKASSIISSASGTLRLLMSTMLCAALDDFILASPYKASLAGPSSRSHWGDSLRLGDAVPGASRAQG